MKMDVKNKIANNILLINNIRPLLKQVSRKDDAKREHELNAVLIMLHTEITELTAELLDLNLQD